MGNAADLPLSTEHPAAPSPPAVSVDLTVAPALGYAMARAAVPVVSRLALTNAGPAVPGATLRLSLRDAAGPIGTPAEQLVDLPVDGTAVLERVGPALDPTALLQVDRRRPAWVSVELESEGRLLARSQAPVELLPPADWAATPLPLALELLAAHVHPGDPAVAALVAEAAQLLEEGTGNASTTAYSDEPDRVDEVVEALTWAMRRRGIRAVESPAGWAEGRPVRTPGEVLDGRVGTSLDTVVTLAAACEHAGIHPLLWVVEEHAFLGYWREARTAASAASTDVTALVDLVDQGLIRLVETTLLTDRGNSSADLQRPAYAAWLSGDRSRVLGVTDVHRARRAGVQPLPTAPVAESPESAEPATTAAEAAEQAPARVRQWLDGLQGSGLRHQLIDPPAGAALPLTVPADALAVLEDLVAGGTTITLLPGDRVPGVQSDPGPRVAADLPAQQLTELLSGRRTVHVDVPDTEYLLRLRDLAHRARTAVEETGANDLHLTLGSLVWELDGRPVRSPLVLLPVVLTAGTAYRLTADESGGSSPNWCLLAELHRRHGLTVPGLPAPAEQRAGIDLRTVLRGVRAALAEHQLPWRVEATAELSVLPSAAYEVAQDLVAHWPDFAANPLVEHLVEQPDEPFTDPVSGPATAVDLDDLAARCPLPADASQLRAVAEATAGRTIVVEGPPGTGKSQTITNLVARAVAEGKRVLVVAAKRTALDVVARRLDAIGMGPFALDLHDKGGRPAVVRAQIRAALEHAVQADEPGLAADAEELHAATRSLARYAEQLHAPNPAGLSFSSARAAVLSAGEDVPALPVPRSFAARADADVVTAVRRALALLPDIASLARPSAGHAWGFLDTIELDIEAVQRAAVAVDTAIRELPSTGGLAAAVRAARTVEDLDTLIHLLTGPRVGLDVLDEVRTQRWTAATSDVTGEVAVLVAAEHPAFEVATPAALALPLADLTGQAQAAVSTGWFARRSQLSALRQQLTPVLRPGAGVALKDVPQLLESLGGLQAAVHTIAARAATIPGIQVPAGWNPFTDAGRFLLETEVRWLRRAAAAVDDSTPVTRALRRFVGAGPVAEAGSVTTVERLRDAVSHLLTVCSSNSTLLAAWSGDDGLVLRWTMTRPERGVEYVHPTSLRRWVSLLDTLEPLRLAGLTDARTQLRHGGVPADDAVRAFDRGLAEASVAERRVTTGLDSFDGGQHERTAARFAAASRAVRSHLTAALPAGILAARSVPAGELTALRRELAPQRGGLGVRGLLSAHGDLITTVLPCVLASPHSVARLLPATPGLFDLVVFDEASQLTVAEAVGALGRAEAAVVVGDSRQLPPATGSEESLLSECLRAGVPRHELSWHYRSRDEALIAFSNAHYYDHRLATFPAPSSGAPGRGISLVHVEGTAVLTGSGSRTNPAEAQAVVAEVLRRFSSHEPAAPSVAVVAFTAAQRALIEALLRDSGDQRVVQALDADGGEGLLVRGLGEVQGEERDVVLLSTVFSADPAGRLPADLGPLTRSGGERWFNVAISRARRQVVVVTSLTPGQLEAGATSSVAVEHLRGYLELAARGTAALPRPVRATGAADRHRDEIAAALRGRRLVVRTDVGLSPFRIDLTLARPEDPDVPLVAVLLDGPAWARRATVGDRDGVPVEVLGGLVHWPAVERVWLPTWLADPGAELDRLVAVVAAVPAPEVAEPEDEDGTAAEDGPDVAPEPPYDGPLAEVIPLRRATVMPAAEPEPDVAPEPEPELTTAVEPVAAEPTAVEPVAAEPTAAEPTAAEPTAAEPAAVEPVQSLERRPEPAPVPSPPRRPAARSRAAARSEPLDEELPFIAWAPKPAGEKKQLDQLSDPAVARVVRRVLAAGVKAEGPVHRDRLVRLTAGAFGLTRVTAARRDALLALLPRTAVPVGDFIWPAALDRDTWTWFRRQASGTERPLDQIAPEEIGNAMAALSRAAAGLARDELYGRTLEVFGHRRRTPAQLPVLDAALDLAVTRGWLAEQPGGVFTA